MTQRSPAQGGFDNASEQLPAGGSDTKKAPNEGNDDDRDDDGHFDFNLGDSSEPPDHSGTSTPATEASRPRRPVLSEDIAREEKPGAEASQAPIKDPKVKAAESAHVRGLSTVASDAWITSRVKLNLVADSKTPGMKIEVDTMDGVVTLFGIVPSDEGKASSEADASAVEGVRRVRNLLQVVSKEQMAEVDLHDQQILRLLRKGLDPYPDLRSVHIDVKNCVVRLTGTVRPGKRHDEAMQVVRTTPGVCAVEDDLRFAGS